MNVTMAISRSCETGKYLVREGDRMWRMDENGKVDCTASGPPTLFELLHFLQRWKTPSLCLLQEYPQQDRSN